MRKVTIVGLVGHQADQIERAFGDRLKLTFIDARNVTRVGPSSSGSDAVVIMTKFISHANVRDTRHHPGLLRCNGGLSSLKSMLEGLC